MIKHLSILLIVFCAFSIHAQTFELFGGLSKNAFYDIQESRPDERGSYTSSNNAFIGIGLHEIVIDDIEFGITLNYEKYSGTLNAFSGGSGGGRSVDAMIDKSLLSFGIFPFNKYVYKKFYLSIGVVFSTLIRERFEGTDKTPAFIGNTAFDIQNISEKYQSYSTTSYFGFKANLFYEINLSEKLILAPQYSFYIGLFEEFLDFPRATKAMRHYFGIGIKRKLMK